MNKQTQWLFEALPVLESAFYFNQEDYSNPEWEFQEANLYGLGEEEWEQPVGSSPRGQTIRETISGFSRYSNAIPPQERGKIAKIAQMIVQSYQSRQPIRTVRLVGHADRDVQRGANFEKKMSGDRALAVQKALIAAIKNPSIASQISWQTNALGATQLVVANPRTENDRRRNRRVEINLDRVQHSPNKSILIRDSLWGYAWYTPNTMTAEAELHEGDFDIIPPDSRTVIRDTLPPPFHWICKLDMTMSNSSGTVRARGSGTLISPRHVLTAGHNIVHQSFGTAQTIVVTPAFNPLAIQPAHRAIMGVQQARILRTHPSWATPGATSNLFNNDFDFGLITLDREVPSFWGNRGGNTRLAALSLSVGTTVRTAGYPGDKCLDQPPVSSSCSPPPPPCSSSPNAFLSNATQWISSGRIIAIDAHLLGYDNDTCVGQSGSPVWITTNNLHTLVAVHTGVTSATSNRGVLITKSVLQQLRRWMDLDRVVPLF